MGYQVQTGIIVSDELFKTVRIVRRSKVATDDRGRTVWVDPVESAELELVTTTMLTKMLDSDDEQRKQRIQEVAQGKDGLLAHDAENDRFEIIDDADLQAAIEASAGEATPTRGADVTYEVIAEREDADEELSLVSTQALRRILHSEDADAADSLSTDDDGGFDPYNRG